MPKHLLDVNDPLLVRKVVATLVETTPVGYAILDRNLRVHYVNDFYLKLRKYEYAQVIGNFCYNVFNNGSRCSQCTVIAALQSGKRSFLARKDYLVDGAPKYIDDYAIPIMNQDGSFDFVLEVLIDRSKEMLIREENQNIFIKNIELLTSLLEKKDLYTYNHSSNVTNISMKLARWIGLEEEEIQEIRLAALLHDLGKIVIPDRIINKPTPLTKEEFAEIKRHPDEAFKLLVNLSRFNNIKHIVHHHHERWDGKGYPDGLAGEQIPFASRLLALADTYDAITSTRSYRDALAHEDAIQEIMNNSGSQFDPSLARVFLEMMEYEYNDRNSMIALEIPPNISPRHTRPKIERQLVGDIKDAARVIDHQKIQRLMASENFAKEVFAFTPGYCLILDDEFNILYASQSLCDDINLPMQELLTKRCYEILVTKQGCSYYGDDEKSCPVTAAFKSGQTMKGQSVRHFKGVDKVCETLAVPLELEDRDDCPFPCVMEILIDRENMAREQAAGENDVKQLLNKLYPLVGEMDNDTTESLTEIHETCNTFSDYLKAIAKKLTSIVDSN